MTGCPTGRMVRQISTKIGRSIRWPTEKVTIVFQSTMSTFITSVFTRSVTYNGRGSSEGVQAWVACVWTDHVNFIPAGVGLSHAVLHGEWRTVGSYSDRWGRSTEHVQINEVDPVGGCEALTFGTFFSLKLIMVLFILITVAFGANVQLRRESCS